MSAVANVGGGYMRSLLIVVVVAQLIAIYLFTSGFLLSRLSLSNQNTCSTCSLEPTHARAVVLIIDALRFDFVSANPPTPPSPFHHNVLGLPQRLTAMYPENSFLFDAYSDPPTATLQRIKAITTGSLPTFVDIGSNFGGSSILEDSIIARLKAAGKRLAFMGDDTWMTVFPDSFNPNMTHSFDSFNVEDLHTVDRGVIANLFPLLAAPTPSFDFLIGHFLGVDHVGHRVGPEHISMKDKLQEMNSVLERVVEMLDDDTLLVVLGDHGMDRSGDHGGDGDLETSSALWIYSKTRKLSQASSGEDIPSVMTPKKTFPGSSVPHRRVQQIDLVPTLSLLLGLPIPFNNLGTVIPELFNRESLLSRALSINVAQIKDYLDAYRSSASGRELDASWSSLTRSWTGASATQQQYEFTRLALETCRSLWAQFNAVRMGMGLILLGVGTLTTWSIYSTNLSPSGTSNSLLKGGYGLVAGLALGLTSFPLIKSSSMFVDISLSDHTLFLSTLFSCVPILGTSFASSTIAAPSLATALQVLFPILLLVLHSLAFLSNSFTFWEDRLAPFLLVSSILPFVVKGFTAPTARLRSRIFGFSLAFALCIRLMAISTICREEQQPYCHVTFYSSSSTPTSPLFIRLLALPVAYGLPLFIQRMLAISRSDAGIAKLFLLGILRISLLSSAAAWLLEWVDSARLLEGSGWNNDSPRTARTMATWVACFVITFVGTVLWYLVPMCLDIKQEEGTADEQQLAAATLASAPKTRQIKIIGFANAFGAPYVLFYSIPFALVFASTQLTGQVVLALSMVALLAYLEVVDSVRDVRALEAAFSSATPSAILNNPNLFGASSSSPSSSSFPSPSIRFAEIVPIALLGIQTFYSTGHQAVISSIQWKSAFILTRELKYPWSVVTVVLNSVGPILLAGLAAPLLGLWNRAPLQTAVAPEQLDSKKPPTKAESTSEPPVSSQTQIRVDVTRASLGVMLYYSCLLLGTAVSAAILRRHLMVWKVFAPRFMLGICQVLAVDLGVVLGIFVGVERIAKRVGGLFEIRSK